jgi:hypothetical protein
VQLPSYLVLQRACDAASEQRKRYFQAVDAVVAALVKVRCRGAPQSGRTTDSLSFAGV